jgi:hypothetical protein
LGKLACGRPCRRLILCARTQKGNTAFSRAARLALAAAAPLLAAAHAAQQRCDTNIRVVNTSSHAVSHIFYNPTGDPNRGQNRLGTQVMRPGQCGTVRRACERPCDFGIAWQGGGAAAMRHTGICRINPVVVTNDGLRVREHRESARGVAGGHLR